MRSLHAILLLLLATGIGEIGRAQDLTGQWTGSATPDATGKKQKLVITITEGDSTFGGILHWYFPETQTIRHFIVSGRFYGRDSVLTMREDSIAGSQLPGGGADLNRSGNAAKQIGVGFSILYYKRGPNHKETLEGLWKDPRDTAASREQLAIRLEKKAPPFIPVALPPRKKDTAQSKQLLGRQSVVAATLPAHGTDTIKVELYDNGEIDGDSVSLYLNNNLLLQHQQLTAEPKVLLIPLDRNTPVNRLVLFAENLGRLPPNTALMMVTVRGKTYTLFLSTDYSKNASVEFNMEE